METEQLACVGPDLMSVNFLKFGKGMRLLCRKRFPATHGNALTNASRKLIKSRGQLGKVWVKMEEKRV